MVGGGPDGFIGNVHRHAMALDGLYTVAAGVFSRDPAKSIAFGAQIGIGPTRLYDSYEKMAEAEAALPDTERVEVVVIVTPTPSHAEVALTFISRGFAVVCDKPLCSTIPEADRIMTALASQASPKFMLIHNYSGYPMVKQARHIVSSHALGDVKKVIVEYEQGWLCEEAQLSTTKSISSLADVGTHALQLLQYVSGLQVEQVFADVAEMIGGARSPDDANILLRLSGGIRGVFIASQASAGQGNGLRLRVYGTKGGLIWRQESPEKLEYMPVGAPLQIMVRGGPGLCQAARSASRIPGGHPEGFLEAFANLYKGFHAHVCASAKDSIADAEIDFPTAADGRAGIAFIEAAMQSSETERWVAV